MTVYAQGWARFMRRGGYSRFIYFLKILLPLIAIALLATVFLATKERGLEGGLSFSKIDMLALESGIRITKPRFSGSNATGDSYYFSADLVLPDAPNPSQLKVDGISGEIQFAQGTSVQITAQKAEYEVAARKLRMAEGVSIVFSDGLSVKTDGLVAELGLGRFLTDGAVTATSPMGDIAAGLLRIETEKHDGEENRMIWFENGVKLSIILQNSALDKDIDE